jgi:hypothetical protein
MWEPGDVIVGRQVLNDGRCWAAMPGLVVCDHPELLATYTPPGAPFDFPPGRWPTPDGLHPWHGRTHWEGNGMLALHRPADWYAIFVFWHGEERRFTGWYVNMQEPLRRTPLGFDTQDLELDVWVPVDGPWELKDDELLEERVREGRFTAEQVARARAEARLLTAELDAGHQWWDPSWAEWEPDPTWAAPDFPAAYSEARDLQP